MDDMSAASILDAPADLVVETGGDTFPVAGPSPELSWKLPPTMARQLSFELEASIGNKTFRYAEETGRHRFIGWPWQPLTSMQLVSWRVRVHGEAGPTAWSLPATFETGLFEPDWTTEWITSPSREVPPVGERPACEFSTSFNVKGPIASARLYTAALGVYEVLVNGRRAGTAELMPGSESYDRTLYAQAIDVTAELQDGENNMTLRLSDGWFRGRAGAFRQQAAWGEETALRAELHVNDGTASRLVAGTNATWLVSESTVIRADLMDGQVEDMRRTPTPIGHAVPASAQPPAVSWSPAPPIRVVEELLPKSITRLGADDAVVDFGQNASGRVRLTSLGEAGAVTKLLFGEHVGRDGNVTLTHLDAPTPDGGNVAFVQEDQVTSNGEGNAFEPRHTVHGFQYVQIHRKGLDLTEADVTMQVLHSDLREVGSFDCSNPDLNRLWDVAKWSFRGNAVDVPTDCPTRERAGWTGDWQIFLPTAERLYDVNGFSRKWLQSVRDDQLDDGRIVNISPDNSRLRTIPDPGVDFATGSAGWGDAITLVPWELYQTYGDTTVLAESWEAMTRWVEFALRSAAQHRHPSRVERSAEPLPHEQYIWDGTFHFGEWLEPTPIAEDGTPGPTIPDPIAWATADKGEVGTAYLYRSVATLASVAAVLGKLEDERHYSQLANNIREAWRAEFIDNDGRTPGNTQASYVRALSFDLAPSELRDRAAAHLVGLIEAADNHLGTGFLSTADLLPVLADTGHADLAYRLLLQRTTPSWLGMLDRGATTIWEEWEGVDRNGNAHASLNHYSKGSVVRYLHTHILGLQAAPDSVAWESFIVAPVVPDELEWASGHFDSPQGRIDVSWRLKDDAAELSVVVPGGSTAMIIWGDQRVQAGPGRHVLHTWRLVAAVRA